MADRVDMDQLARERGHPDPDAVKIDHPDFFYLANRGKEGYPVAVFKRWQYREPTVAQIADYRWRAQIVEQLGGMMKEREWQVAGRNEPFTADDIAAMRRAVTAALPGWEIREDWNGEGYYGYSISVKRKAPAEPAKE